MRAFFKGLKRTCIVILGLVLVWGIMHQILSHFQMSSIKNEGTLVEVDGKRMNVYSLGHGENTIVLMPGLGTAAPVLDFEPLAEQLAEDNRVVIAEPFGYGWSDITSKERSVENIVDELRTALKEEGEQGPYILMPHSISGIYAAWYADHYPEEVSAIIGIDCTLPRQIEYFDGTMPSMPQISKAVNPLGISRLVTIFSSQKFLSDNAKGIYSEENLRKQKIISAAKGYNKNVIDEMNDIEANIEKTKEIKFDSRLPLLFFTRTEAEINAREDGKTRRSFYETYITNPQCQKVIELDSKHYMHWSQSSAISKEAKLFIDKINAD